MIRPVTRSDVPAVVDLAVASGLFAADQAGVVEQLMADYFSGTSTGGHTCLLDFDEDAGPVAVAYYEPAAATDRTWYLTMIAVRSVRQGQGRGTALLEYLEEDLRARGQRLLLVETSGVPAFARTRAFYERCGYAKEACVRDYYEQGDDMILFRKVLGA